MGTSQSSKGPSPKVPLVPPWADNGDIPSTPNNPPDGTLPLPNGNNNPIPVLPPIAPARRFQSARTGLNRFARNGDKSDLKRGIGNYVKTGYGGSKTATARLGRSISTAEVLFNVLSSSVSGKQSADFPDIDFISLKGKNPEQITDTIIEAIRPIDGDLDSEVSRNSMKDAFSELLGKHENADLLNLTDEQRWFVIEKFIAGDVFARFDLDMGKEIRKNAPSPVSAASRLKDAMDYINETVSSLFEKIDKTTVFATKTIRDIIEETLEDAYHVFESEAI